MELIHRDKDWPWGSSLSEETTNSGWGAFPGEVVIPSSVLGYWKLKCTEPTTRGGCSVGALNCYELSSRDFSSYSIWHVRYILGSLTGKKGSQFIKVTSVQGSVLEKLRKSHRSHMMRLLPYFMRGATVGSLINGSPVLHFFSWGSEMGVSWDAAQGGLRNNNIAQQLRFIKLCYMVCREIDALHIHWMFTEALWKICWHLPFTVETQTQLGYHSSGVMEPHFSPSWSDLKSLPLTGWCDLWAIFSIRGGGRWTLWLMGVGLCGAAGVR